MQIHGIPAFTDNYFWLLSEGSAAVVVDPGDAAPVKDYLQQHNLNLIGILLTHHHADHCGGVAELAEIYQPLIYGPHSQKIPWVSHIVDDQDSFSILNSIAKVFTVPGHTLDHIAYLINDNLFCGDTLFAGGCGRIFEGTPAQMFTSLQKINALAEHTKIYCAHEYTESNLKFALQLEPDNQLLQQRVKQVKLQRNKNIPTVPSTLALEKATNPFLRCDVAEIINAANCYTHKKLEDAVSVFAAIREWKNVYV